MLGVIRRSMFCAIGLVPASCMVATLALGQNELPLWPAEHPANQGDGPASHEKSPNRLVVNHHPSVLVYKPEASANGAAVLICPGGGYGVLAIDHEGWDAAEWLNARGITAFVLKYRCGADKNLHPDPLDDAKRAMRIIRANAEQWDLDSNRIGILGFSAGGHLAATASTLFDGGVAESDDPIEQVSSRPDYSVLVYPLTTLRDDVTHRYSKKNLLGPKPTDEMVVKLSADKQVTKQTPPTFIAHASDDGAVLPENAILYYRALLKHDVPAELHLYQGGGHGFGMRTLESKANNWLGDLDRWLARNAIPASPEN